MQISIANAILVARLIGKSIVTACLKMFLPFKTSQQLGEEKITNGDFVDTLSPSTVVNAAGTSNITWDAQGGGSAKLIYNSVDSTAIYLNLPNVNMVSGKTYYIVIDSTAIVSGSQFKLNQGNGTALSGALTAGGISSFYRTATVTNSALRLYRNASGDNSQLYINSISVKEVGQFSLDETTNNNNAKLLTGNCLDFDGLNDYVSFNDTNLTGEFTIAAWVNVDSFSNAVMVGETGNANWIRLDSSTSITVKIANISTGYAGLATGGIISQNQWTRVVVTRQSDNIIRFGINGIFYSPSTRPRAGTFVLNAFGRKSNTYFNGRLSDVQIWDAAWSATDVANDYAKPNEVVSSVPTVNLVGYWAMTEGNGGLAYDSSSLLSAEKVSNGTFELGSEDVSNGDFELGSEIIVDGNFPLGTSAWSPSASGITFGDGFVNILKESGSGSTDAYIYQDILQASKSYKVVFSGVITSGTLFFGVNGDTAAQKRFTAGTYSNESFVFTASAALFQIRNPNTGSTINATITNVSVKEFTDWIVQQPSGQVVNVANNQVSINYSSSQTQGSTGIAQTVFTNNKTYETTIDVASVTGTFKVQAGNVNHVITTAGVKTFTNKATDTALFIVRNSNSVSFEATINSVSVKEVTDWTLAAGWSVANGKANANTSGNYKNLTQSNIFEVGKTYTTSFEITAISQGSVRLSQAGIDVSGFKSSLGVYTTNYTAISTGSSDQLIMQGFNSFIGTIGNISIKEVTPADNGAITNGASWLTAQSTIPQLGMMDWSKGSNLLTYSEDFSQWTGNFNTEVGGFISPLGDASAYKISGSVATTLSTGSSDLTGRTRSDLGKNC